MNNLKKILILEDNLSVVSKICSALHELESSDNDFNFSVTVLSTHADVKEMINDKGSEFYDVILLDRDCKEGGSFHILDIEKFNPARIIAISSVPEWNREVENRGVSRVIDKDLAELDLFTMIVVKEIVSILRDQLMSEK